jgi:hypothetical protein
MSCSPSSSEGNQKPNHTTLEARLKDNLDGSNYHTWKFKMEMIFLEKDLWSVVDETNVKPNLANGQIAWDRRDQRARANLITNLRNNQMHLVTTVKTSMKVWDKLATIIETKDITSNVFATTPFYSQKMKLRM